MHASRDLYLHLLAAPWLRVLAIFVSVFLVTNALFALGYVAGTDSIENARPGSFVDAFFFSVQTMATIGYGKLAPRTLYANVLVTVEVLIGVVGLAIATGLAFAKFSRPTARVLFSGRVVIAPHEGVPSLMFRMANARGNNIVEAQLHVVLAREETTREGEAMRRFHDLRLLRPQTALFTLSWTAIHPITDGSPLAGATPEDLERHECVRGSRRGCELAVADRRHRLDAEEERIRERPRPRVLDAPRERDVRERENRVRPQERGGKQPEEAWPRRREQLVVEVVGEPSHARRSRVRRPW